MVNKTIKKTCPFCGTEPDSGVGIPQKVEDATEFGWVKCINTNCHVRPKLGETNIIGIAEARAIERWNYRQ